MDWWPIVALAFIAWFMLVVLFTPRIDYHVTVPLRPDSDDFNEQTLSVQWSRSIR